MASSARTSTDREHSDFEHIHATSTPQSLSKAVHARRAEYTRPQKIKVKIGTWNVAACPGTEKDLGGWFVQGKGIDKRLAGLQVTEGIEEDGSQAYVESVEAQEARRSKKSSTLPIGDQGTIAGGDEIGLYVLGLQEVVDLASATQYIGRVYTDLEPTNKWRKALAEALPTGYVLIAEQQLSGLLLFIFASPTVAPTISSVSTVSVGTGVMGYLGNKGAVTTRLILGETTRMVFVNSHLASGNDPAHFERRCWDVTQVLQRTRFDPISWAGVLDDGQEAIGEEDFAFWFGDLNFRLEGLPGDDIRRLLMLHTKGEYDVGAKSRTKIDGELEEGSDGPIIVHSVESDSDSEGESEPRTSSSFDAADDASSSTLPDPDDFVQDPSQDPASLQATLDSLLPHDQLRRAMKTKKAFHDGWREGPVTFLPTYKYDVGSMGMFDSSEKKRAPSWCDRILFRTRKDKFEYDGKLQEEELARIKDEEMKARGIDHALDEEDVLFDYNPDEDGVEDVANNVYDEYDEGGDDDMGEAVVTKEGYIDRIHLDVYTSHQRVLSSDHKPLDAVFTLEYDAVVPELKAKVHQEVARELDRAENEGRPGITLVVDHSADDTPPSSSSREHSGGSTENISVDFGKVAYGHRKSRALTIANTSQVASTFAFVERPTESGEADRIAPPWLSVCFVGYGADEDERLLQDMKREVTLEPGEAINATLDVFIDDITMVRALNQGTAKLEDVLVLRVTEGRDHFVPIRASWLQSCFGRSVDELIRIPEGGVRALVPPKNGSGGAVNRGQEVCWSAPRELFKLTEAVELLIERVIADSNMLENVALPKDSPGWPFDEHTWRLKDTKAREVWKSNVLEALDSDKVLNESFPPEIPAFEKLEIMSEILINFLRSLKDGVVPASLWDKLDADMTARGNKPISDIEEKKAWVLDVLSSSPNHNISFVFLTSMLNRVAGELAPIPKSGWNPIPVSGTRKSLESVRRSLSWKGRAPPLPNDPAVQQREKVEKAYADIFKDVIFRFETANLKDKERRAGEDRRKEILEAFLKGGREI
ncbi:phosphatase family protein-like protein [Mollisia scopiformis]|uniref:Phosphatase family protein-like protein n=1 Tax=Mollisia scopiformis TaxID=149040 RepID=A0A194WZI5_MOLSC|nr:phosphatase family protein-like protein [Mollisia scopiformis]KUJ13017.1 phosphatase family protein-like protein [Mollisia scopiformis]